MARALTQQEVEVAKILKKAWQTKKSLDSSYSQERLGAKLDLTQGSVSQYLGGTRSIGLELLIKFCTELDVNILDVYPDILIQNKVEDTAKAIEFLTLFVEADEGVQNGVLAILRSSGSQ